MRGAHPPTPDPAGAGGAGGDATSWVSAVASCRGSDLVVGAPSRSSLATIQTRPCTGLEARHAWAAGTCGGTRLQLVASRGQSGVRGARCCWVWSWRPVLQASGAGDGMVRLWAVQGERPGAGRTLEPLGGLPARGFVNALQVRTKIQQYTLADM